ncbi:hypothetical protein EDC01DRAFT_611892 [Geopyxis carbonaria]|nr:hypothetical protein EDC01DRAFT_611892 [Geopyxis carbonaria]
MDFDIPSMTDAVYTGVWEDHATNSMLLTLPTASAQILLAGMVVLVTFAANSSWNLWRYLLHGVLRMTTTEYVRAQQVVLRNSDTASSGLIAFFWGILVVMWRRRQSSRKGWARAIGLTLFMILHWAGFIALSILTARIARGNVVVSDVRPTCGIWLPKGFDPTIETERDASLDEMEIAMTGAEQALNDTLNAENYVRNCYDPDSLSIFSCSKMMIRALSYSEDPADCPFDEDMCTTPDGKAWAMDSGDVGFEDLGINFNGAGSFSVQRRTVCSTLPEEPFRLSKADLEKYLEDGMDPGLNVETARAYAHFTAQSTGENETHAYDPTQNSTGYQLEAYRSTLSKPVHPPVAPIAPRGLYKDADLSFAFLRTGNVSTTEPSDDPLFLFTIPDQSPKFGTRYTAERYLNVLACVELSRFCNTKSKICTPWRGLLNPDLPDLDPLLSGGTPDDAVAAFPTLLYILRSTSIYEAISSRGETALQARRFLFMNNMQRRLGSAQWKYEFHYWFEMCLARLQLGVFSTIQMRPGLTEETAQRVDLGKDADRICGRVKFRAEGYTSLSVLGVALVIAITGVLTVLSYIDVIVATFWGRRWSDTVDMWDRSEMLELLRRVEMHGEEDETGARAHGDLRRVEQGDVKR